MPRQPDLSPTADRPYSRALPFVRRASQRCIEVFSPKLGRRLSLSSYGAWQRVKRTSERCFEVAENGVDPFELGQIARLKGTHDHRNMDAPRVGDCCEAAQAIAGHDGARRQSGLGPLADGLRGEAADQAELEVKRTAFVIERDCSHKRHLVLGATADLAARPLTAQVGIVKLDRAAQAMVFVLLGHGPVDLVVQQPSRGVSRYQ